MFVDECTVELFAGNGGDNGGEVIGTGTPEEIAKISNSYTGEYLKKVLN